ncbi:MAG: hypothetical protein HC927_00735 [Deltaproteobacteria bacterium]|nr:hypothetical protein [Deltaproteobacteria bacterium]
MTSENARVADLERKIRELEEELARKNQFIDLIYQENPDGVVIVTASGEPLMNAAAVEIMNMPPQEGSPDDWSSRHGIYRPDRVTLYPSEQLPLSRALLTGEVVDDELMWIQNAARPEGFYLSASARPLPGGGAIAIIRDVTDKRRLAEDLERRNAELAAREAENRALIEQLASPSTSSRCPCSSSGTTSSRSRSSASSTPSAAPR